MNNLRYNKEINVNFVIPPFVLDTLENNKSIFLEIEFFQEKLKTFDSTKSQPRNLMTFEISHDQITEFIAKHPEMFEEGWSLVKKEFDTNSVGKIDVLLKNQNNNFLVIEVKKETAKYEPVGQILSYINWVKKTWLNKERSTRHYNLWKTAPSIRICF